MSKRRLVVAGLAAGAVVAVVVSLRTTSLGIAPPLPAINVPADNPQSAQKITLGRRLFYDRRLSVTGTIACANCHQQQYAFADPRPRSPGARGELTPRNAMSLTNVAYNGRFTWANDRLKTLEQQALVPLTGTHPVEMGMHEDEEGILSRLRGDAQYAELFAAAFPGDAIDRTHIVRAISSFVRTLVSFDAPFDRSLAGDRTAVSDAAQRGFTLFRSSRLKCGRCHDGFNFRTTPGHRTSEDDDSVAYHNTGLYNLADGSYPASDRGLIDITGNAADMGRFKAPTLRNVAVTAPYMHDGSIATLEEVVDHYAAGGRTIAAGPDAGIGRNSPYKSEHVSGFDLTPDERRDVVEFLKSLTDERFLTNPSFANPFPPDR